ncbi:PAS domain-containing protein cky-1 isoform X2 [Frankliniella occidentalis]|uniref:PAS domain-containing protein cky-1 isoform X2 n=1 Tax=Frankliniella occidentalis TaxID=133901 RepID=A0A9C6TZR8_FRAOC|nr:PAS domain-containing protein cky-1 isoform X2 [Frankliniella occidentalis]
MRNIIDDPPASNFDAGKSTKGASKLRRDLINAEIANLRDLLPLPPSTRQRLSQLQLMALVCVYVRKANYFQQVMKRPEVHLDPTPNLGFSKALSGFLMMMTQNGKLLYISDNAAEYLGHSMEDLLIHGDSAYDLLDRQDHAGVQTELLRSGDDERLFLCRMNVSRNARRQMRFGDQKVVLVQGHYLSFVPLCARNEPVFLATCTPVAMPETRECVVQGATNVFTTIHAMDMTFLHVDKNGEFHLGFCRSELQSVSWYHLLHWDCMREAQSKHRLITQSEQERSCILLLRLQRRLGDWLWVHCVLQVKDNMDNSQTPVIVCTNQVLSDREAAVMAANSWLYQHYTMQSKLQYGLALEAQQAGQRTTQPPAPSTPTPYMSPYMEYQHHPGYLQPHQAPSPGVIAYHPGHVQHPHPHHPHHHHHHVNGNGGGLHHLDQQHQLHVPIPHNPVTTLHTPIPHVAPGGGLHTPASTPSSRSPEYPTTSALGGPDDVAARFHYRPLPHGAEPVDYSRHSDAGSTLPGYALHLPTHHEDLHLHGHHHPVGHHPSPHHNGLNKRKASAAALDDHHHIHHHPLDSRSPPESTSPRSSSSPSPGDHLGGVVTPASSAEDRSGGAATSVLVAGRQHALSGVSARHRGLLHVKTAAITDPTELMEQWNPSPPWSDTTVQRVPDLSHQELSPYVTATPPTPTGTPGCYGGAPSHQPGAGGGYSAFSFDLTPEQYVPNVMPPGAPPPPRPSGPGGGGGEGGGSTAEQHEQQDLMWAEQAERRLFPLHPPPLSRTSGVILAAPPRPEEAQPHRSPAADSRDSGGSV